MGHYELAPFADVYTQLMFTDVRSVAQIAPGGIFFDTATINCDNPFLSAPASDDDRLRRRRQRQTQFDGRPSWLIRTSCRCTSAVVTSKAVVASRTSTTLRSVA